MIDSTAWEREAGKFARRYAELTQVDADELYTKIFDSFQHIARHDEGMAIEILLNVPPHRFALDHEIIRLGMSL